MEYKEEKKGEEKKETLEQTFSKIKSDANISYDNAYLSTSKKENDFADELIALCCAFHLKDIPLLISQLHLFKTFLSFNENIQTMPEFNDNKIDEILFETAQQQEDPAVRKFSYECLALLLVNGPKEIYDKLLSDDIFGFFCSSICEPYFKGKEAIYLGLYTILNRNKEYNEQIITRIDFEAFYSSAVECVTSSHTDYATFFFYEIIKNIELDSNQCKLCLDFLTNSMMFGVNVKVCIQGISLLLKQSGFDLETLKSNTTLNDVQAFINTTNELEAIPYAIRLCADLAERGIAVEFDAKRILVLVSENHGIWFSCAILDSITKLVILEVDGFLNELKEMEIIQFLFSMGEGEFNVKMSVIWCLSEVISKLTREELIDLCNEELITFILFGIESQREEVVLSVLRTIYRIETTPELSMIIEQSELSDYIDEISELDQSPEIEEISKLIVDSFAEE